ncbi:DNA methyltransferase [Streptomyces sp. NPDC088732]|uniref:DNA methyltransferase n=1 Tax=Streptomyces sp. NPDC088732 TaxID=3365879 RepID=UPI003830DE00
MSVYFDDGTVRLLLGDAIEQMRTLSDGSVNCIVTSPPYYGLRDYGTQGQYGLEASPAEYVERMRQVFSEARRVLADDGTLWLNLGASLHRD